MERQRSNAISKGMLETWFMYMWREERKKKEKRRARFFIAECGGVVM